MTFEQFDKFQAELLAEVVKMKDTKGREYAHSEDRFANFNRLAEELEMSPEKVLWIYFTKHKDSIVSFLKTRCTFSNESIYGRIVDAITYLTLLAGMIREWENNTNIITQAGTKPYPDFNSYYPDKKSR
jgi:hypothetical protein